MEKAANHQQQYCMLMAIERKTASSDPTHLGHHIASSQASCAQFPLAIFFCPCYFNDLNTVVLRRNIFSMADKIED